MRLQVPAIWSALLVTSLSIVTRLSVDLKIVVSSSNDGYLCGEKLLSIILLIARFALSLNDNIFNGNILFVKYVNIFVSMCEENCCLPLLYMLDLSQQALLTTIT